MCTRGSTSAEYFLKAGYAVIFMHRQFSLQPFSRHYSHSTHPFLDFLDFDPSEDPSEASHIVVRPSERAQLLEVLTAYKAVQRAGTLLTLTFVTVNDYLWLLRAVSQEMSLLGRSCLYYLAAAVSDFFLPRQKMYKNGHEKATSCRSRFAFRQPFDFASFLTHPPTAGDRSRPADSQGAASACRYGHQVVIGNDLHHRKFSLPSDLPPPPPAFPLPSESYQRSMSLPYSEVSGSPPPDSEVEDDDYHITMTDARRLYSRSCASSDDEDSAWDGDFFGDVDADTETQWDSPGPRSPSVQIEDEVSVKQEPTDVRGLLDAWENLESQASYLPFPHAVLSPPRSHIP
ncbi:hypothetical protein NUW54_g4200 [Trametes sanguinea]|uniref:Uncharacterized protein n=1 Tax=Trametes sanguinea TaxID=158606 RepID=A0ACC1Q0Q2_9APHY|nr:hypothetical protein NUW54_g4200 [Trametes sanguinea]